MTFVYPDYKKNSIYNLAVKLSDSLGVNTQRDPIDINLEKDKTILVLIDGFGINYVKRLNINMNYRKITTVFPSTTASVITTLFTAMMPGEHGVIGYTNYTNDIGVINPMRFTFNGLDTSEALQPIRNFTDEYDIKPYLKNTNKKYAVIMPGRLDKTTFTSVMMEGDYYQYKFFWDSIYQLDNAASRGYDFIYYYIPFIDSLAHAYGTYQDFVLNAADEIINNVKNSVEKYKDNYNIIITADHGHVPVSENVIINDNKDLLERLDIMPYGDSRAMFLKTRQDISDLIKYENVSIFKYNDIINKNLLGNVSQRFLNRVGDYLLLPEDGRALIYKVQNNRDKPLLKSHHGGLTEDEQLVPLIYI
ncbi:MULTISPECIES: alkaline phosphatase family protein [Acidiplasma]|uniref:Phosphodiesterase n=1 Tax=Acidiplasma cupricumulans TaxID=312540 RepID=A0A0Q1B5K5_9ARCH|nr:alkaline phosphatase family protein [Acidiplasma cupricumulans]KQB35331.1 hypothetical protein AOG55_07095 [Acidiplasma cupricumulans]